MNPPQPIDPPMSATPASTPSLLSPPPRRAAAANAQRAMAGVFFVEDDPQKPSSSSSTTAIAAEGERKLTKYVPPRVDSSLYQTNSIPGPFDRSKRAPSPSHPSTRIVHGGTANSEYLRFCRNLLGLGWINVEQPLEEDEQALEFLQEQDGDVEKAKLFLMSSLGGGVEDGVLELMQARETKRRVKGGFRSAAAAAAMNGEDGEEMVPAKIKSAWRDWIARCRKTPSQPQVTGMELKALQREGIALPKFASRTVEEDSIMSQAHDLLCDLDGRMREIEIFTAQVHDALSLVRAGKRWSTGELKVLLDEIPKKVVLKEVELLKDVIAKSEEWEKKASEWLSTEEEEEPVSIILNNSPMAAGAVGAAGGPPGATATGGAPLGIANNLPVRRPGGRKPSAFTAAVSAVAAAANATALQQQDHSFAALGELIRKGKVLTVDHTITLRALEKKQQECESILGKLLVHIPQDRSWRSNRTLFDILKLDQLKEILREVRRLKLRAPEAVFLDAHIRAADEWLAAMKHAMSEKSTVKDLQSLIFKTENIPVDLSVERRELERFLEKATEWVKKAKAMFPNSSRGGAISIMPPKRPRGNTAAAASPPTEDGAIANLNPSNKMMADDIIALRDQARDLNLDALVEAGPTFEVADTIENFTSRVRKALKGVNETQLDYLNELLAEADDLPVYVAEERLLRQETAVLNWVRRSKEFIMSKKGEISLAKYETLLSDAHILFQQQIQDPNSTKRRRANQYAPRRLTSYENEDALVNCVDEAKKWIARADAFLQPREGGGEKMTLIQIKALMAEETQCDVGLVRQKVLDRLKEIARWQRKAKARLIRTGGFKEEDFRVSDEEGIQTMVIEDDFSDDEEANTQPSKLSMEEFKELLIESAKTGMSTLEQQLVVKADQAVKAWTARYLIVVPDPLIPSAKKKKRRTDGTPSETRLSLQEFDMVELKNDAAVLVVDMADRLRDIDLCLAATIQWREICTAPLQEYRCAVRAESAKQNIPVNRPNRKTLAKGTNYDSLMERLGINVDSDTNALKQATSAATTQFNGDGDGGDGGGGGNDDVREETLCLWWFRERVSDDVRLALDAVRNAMREADEKKLHQLALDSPEVRACAWIVNCMLWHEMLESTFFVGAKSIKPLSVVCQSLLEGMQIGRMSYEDDDLPDQFPESLLELTRAAALRTANGASSSMMATINKRSRRDDGGVETDLNSEDVEETTITTTTSADHTSAAVTLPRKGYLGEEWSILKFCGASSALEVEDQDPSTSDPSLGGMTTRRVFGFQKIVHRAMAWRLQSKKLYAMPKVVRNKRVLDTFLEKSPQWSLKVIVQIAEEQKMRNESRLAAEWMQDSKQYLNGLKDPDTLESFVSRGEKLWVDVKIIEQLNLSVHVAKQWLEKFDNAGIEKGASTVDELKELLAEGEQIHGVSISRQLNILRSATEIFCMCRGGRDENMMTCTDCTEVFHRECIKNFSSDPVCPICQVARAVNRAVGMGKAAMCRAYALELAPQLDVEEVSRKTALLVWMREARLAMIAVDQGQAVLANGAGYSPVSLPPPSIRDCHEVELVYNALQLRKWLLAVERIRFRPSLKDVGDVLRTIPSGFPLDSVNSLSDIYTRAKGVYDTVRGIFNTPEIHPASVIMERLRSVEDKFDTIPIDLSAEKKAVAACVEDGALRHCVCKKLYDGNEMVQCSACDKWYHMICVGDDASKSDEAQDYHCPRCRNEPASDAASV